MNTWYFRFIVGLGILGIIVQLIPWGFLQKRRQQAHEESRINRVNRALK